MTHEKTIGITIFAFLEIIVGSIGSMLLLKNLMTYMQVLMSTGGSTGTQGALALVGIFMYLPAVMFVAAGLATLISPILGKKVNNSALGFLYFMFLLLIIFHVYTAQYSSILLDIIIFFICTLPLQWFLNHPTIKKIEVNQY